ncbi:hypothetical protein ACJJTC_009537 [Scirpophaga incertulas]
MSDKKKKIYTAKEQLSPRRPIILKSDRDSTRDQVKEKSEKDKDKPLQPTIILKTREQSTPKDERPHSPKSFKKTPTSEGDTVHPKIVHNEYKERKEQKTIPLKIMSEPVKLIDENLEFNNAGVEFLSDSSTNYLVVGVVGMQGVGKSMIMNLITQDTYDHNLCFYILNSHDMDKEGFSESPDIQSIQRELNALDLHDAEKRDHTSVDFKFKMQNIEHIEKGTHCTKGVDMYVTSDRVVVLDCQAVGVSRGEDPRGSPTDCLQLTSFLMSVCHVLIAVQDWFTDYNFVRYIQTAEMLTPSLSASSSAPPQDAPRAADAHAHAHSLPHPHPRPHLLLLQNRCQLEDFTPESVKTMQDLYRKAFQKSNVQLKSGMYMYSDLNRNGLDVEQASRGYGAARCGEPLNLFLLPEIYHDYGELFVHSSLQQVAGCDVRGGGTTAWTWSRRAAATAPRAAASRSTSSCCRRYTTTMVSSLYTPLCNRWLGAMQEVGEQRPGRGAGEPRLRRRALRRAAQPLPAAGDIPRLW